MNDLPERSQFESRLPDDQAYWDDLAARIAESAEPVLREYRDDAWWHPLAKWSPAIGVAAAAAAIMAVVTMPAASLGATPPNRPSLEQLLSPEDPVAQAVFGGESAANISTMLLVESGGQP